MRVLAGVLGGGGHVSRASEESNEGFWRGCRGGSGLNHSGCPSTCVLVQPPLLVYLMFHSPPSRSQYSRLIKFVLFTIVAYRPRGVHFPAGTGPDYEVWRVPSTSDVGIDQYHGR